MKPCEWVRENLFGDGEDDAAAAAECREHLASCPACAAEYGTLRHLSGALRPEEAFPRESEVDWALFARETVQRAMREGGAGAAAAGWRVRVRQAAAALFPWGGSRAAGRATSGVEDAASGAASRFPGTTSAWRRPAWAASHPRFSWAAAGVAVVAGGAALMMMPPAERGGPAGGPVEPAVAAIPFEMNEDSLDNLTVNLARQNTARYLNETRAVLVTLLDVGIDCDKDKVDVSAERAKATDLLRRQRLIAAELNRVPLARAQDVCNELERLLVEISTLADCARDEELQTLRDVVEKRQILVRMELLSAELARREAMRA